MLETHPFPADRPTNCAFDDPDLQTLYVTNYEKNDGFIEETAAQLYRAETDRTGYLGAP